MTELPQTTKDTLEELQAPEAFDLGDFIKEKVTYPTREVHVYTDAEKAQEILAKADEIAELSFERDKLIEDDGSIAPPDTSDLDEQIEKLTVEVQALGEALEASALDFTLRGLAPKLWRTIDSSWRHKIKAEKSDTDDQTREKNIERNEKVNIDLVRNAIVKITTADGRVHEGNPHFAQVEALYDSVFETEWAKLKNTTEELTFANALFANASGDADFLPKSSLGDETDDI